VALAFKKTKLILATAYLAEKAFKSWVVIRIFFLTLFPFYQILSHGAGAERKMATRVYPEQNRGTHFD